MVVGTLKIVLLLVVSEKAGQFYQLMRVISAYRGEWMICHFSIIQVHFVFLLIEFHCTFSISFKIIRSYVY